MATESKAPSLPNGGGERGSGRCGSGFIGGQREVDARTARCHPECTIKFATRQLGRGKLSENVGFAMLELLSALCKRNFLPCQFSSFVRLQPRYDADPMRTTAPTAAKAQRVIRCRRAV